MAERPVDPTLVNILNDYSSRLRALERQRLLLPEGTGPLQTLEDGTQLGDTRFLNFGQNIDAVLEGNNYVTISAAATAPEFDAIVDSSLVTSQPANRLFKGIGEALEYLYSTVGLTLRAFVLVRNGTYTETANFNCASDVTLIGAASGFQGGGRPSWNLSTFGMLNTPSMRIQDMFVTTGNKAGMSFFGSNTTNIPTYLFLERAWLAASTFSGIVPLCSAGVIAIDSVFDLFDTTWSNATTGFNHLSNCHLFVRAGRPFTFASGSNSFLTVDDCVISGGSVGNITLPKNTKFHASVGASTWAGGGTAVFTLIGSIVNGQYDIHMSDSGGVGLVTVTLTNADQAEIHGTFSSVSVNAPLTGATHLVEARANTFDISGPAMIDVMATGETTIRGNGVNGHVTTRRSGGSGGTAIAFVSAVDCHIDAANGQVPGAGTTKSYNFDAGSSGNLLVWLDHGAYPVAGTDAGTNNRVLPEGAVPFTTNGHVIQDEGVSLTQRLNLDFAGAGVTATDTAGRTLVTIPATATINGHVIEDEGTPLTQRANMNFVGGGVTVTDAGGKTLVTIPTGGTEPTAMDWMGY